MRQEFAVLLDPARISTFGDLDKMFDQMRIQAMNAAVGARRATRLVLAIETSDGRGA